MTGATRYFCPLDCGWHHDQAAPDFTDPDRLHLIADIPAPEGVDPVAFQAAAGELMVIEAIVKAHLEAHGLTEWALAVIRIKAERDQLAARLAEQENATSWETSCLACARVLDSCYTETMRAEKAEAAVQRVRDWLSEWAPRLPDGACHTLDRALSGEPQDRSTAAAIDETYRYEPPNCQCGHGADRHGPEAGCIECRCPLALARACEHRDPKRLGARPGDLSLWCACGAQVFAGPRTTPNNPPASSDAANNAEA